MDFDFKPILLDLANLAREVRHYRYQSGHYKSELLNKNISILKRFFDKIGECIEDPDICLKFKGSADNYFLKLRVNPNDEFSLLISITVLQYYLNKINMTSTLSAILQEYIAAQAIEYQ